ncbi:MAG: hypothetical protein RIS20_1398 [Bacteroidota bacterium]|jgi:uncharacterized membrane protein
MKKNNPTTNEFISDLSQKSFPLSQKVTSSSISDNLFKFIQSNHPEFKENSLMSISELSAFRVQFISLKLKDQLGELSSMEKIVLDTISNGDQISNLAINQDNTPLSRGQKMADHVASFGGSWTFIISFGFFLFVWILLNSVLLLNKGFDPYPFILLNLILSCIAALQAPIIMMSQNRQEEKDRERSKLDYMVNLKSELEIRTLHEKLDHLIIHQQRDLFEIQEIQIEMMKDITLSIDALGKR